MPHSPCIFVPLRHLAKCLLNVNLLGKKAPGGKGVCFVLVSRPWGAAAFGWPGGEAGGGGCSLRSVYTGVMPEGPRDATEGSCLCELTAGCLSLLSPHSPQFFFFLASGLCDLFLHTLHSHQTLFLRPERKSLARRGLTRCAACPKGCRSPFIRLPGADTSSGPWLWLCSSCARPH